MKHVFLTLLAFFALPSFAQAVWFDSNWDYRVPVEINPELVGTTSAITNFPVFVDLGDFPTSFFDNASSSGADIRVTKADGETEVPFEFVFFSTSSISYIEELFVSDTDWTVPSGVTEITIQAWGGGGGGGDGTNAGGGGGGGGAYASTTISVTSGQTLTLDVGAGGSRSLSAGGAASDGASSTILIGGTYVTYAAGGDAGRGGNSVNTATAAGGQASASYGSTTYSGGTGAGGLNSGDIGGGGGGAAGNTGNGGNASGRTAGTGTDEGGNGGNGGANAGSGANGNFPGGGGGGGETNSTGSTGNGATGAIKLSYNITPYTEYSGELHFLADEISTTSTTTFYVYYGNQNASAYAPGDPYGRYAVWANYDAVFHFHNGSYDALDTISTSTETGTIYGLNYGKLGTGLTFSGSPAQIQTVNNTAILGFDQSITVWAKSTGGSTWIYNNTKPTNAGNMDGYYDGSMRASLYRNNPTFVNCFQVTGSNYANNEWFYSANIKDNLNQKLYVNGDLLIDYNCGTDIDVGGQLTLNQSSSDELKMDELRIANNVILDQAWITTEYNNQSSPSTFYFVGAQETDAAGGGGSSPTDDIIWFD